MTFKENYVEPVAHHPEVKKRRGAILPGFLVRVNHHSTEHVVDGLRESTPNQRLDAAISTYEKIAESTRLASDKWSLDLLLALQKGPIACNSFLEEQGIFSGKDNLLQRPKDVVPGMEIANISIKDYPSNLHQELKILKKDFFAEYAAVKNHLAPPTLPINPRLNFQNSFLVVDLTKEILREERSRKNGSRALVAYMGPGAGEEIVSAVEAGIAGILTYDHATFEETSSLFRTTFQQTGVKCPEVVNLISSGELNTSVIDNWKKADNPKSTIFICPQVDLSVPNAIPENLRGKATTAASLYALHEMPRPDIFAQNISEATKGGVVIVDGVPRKDSFRKVILDVIYRTQLWVTGSQAIITHLLCKPPDEVQRLLQNAVGDRRWSAHEIPTPLPAPFLYPLQMVAVGRR